MQTPALTRSQSFRSPSQQQQQQQQPQLQQQQKLQPQQPQPIASQSPPMPRMPPAASQTQNLTLSTEERGARTINETLFKESRYPDLDSYLSRKFSFRSLP